MLLKEFIYCWKEWGLKVAIGNLFIGWLKSFLRAKRISIVYLKHRKGEIIDW